MVLPEPLSDEQKALLRSLAETTAAAFAYFFVQSLGRDFDVLAIFGVTVTASTILSAPLLVRLSRRIGKKNAYYVAAGTNVSDDPVRLQLTIQLAGRKDSVESTARVRRQGLFWADERGSGGEAQVTLQATNPSGLTTMRDTTLFIPPDRENTALLRRTQTTVPRGYLLSAPTDFDDDGLDELVVNQDQSTGGISDTIRSFEWMGDGFAPADTLLSRAFPRDRGDTDGNGLQELLFQVRGETTVREQSTPTSFPRSVVLGDTAESNIDGAFRGALLADLTGDGADDDGDGWIDDEDPDCFAGGAEDGTSAISSPDES